VRIKKELDGEVFMKGPYVLPELPFAYDALEPYVDAQTMKIHHDGHHKTYVEKLNEALGEYPSLAKRVEELLASLPELPLDIQTEIKNNAGGHANHSLFWSLLTPHSTKTPLNNFAHELDQSFGNFSTFQERFTKVAVEHFSNGWAWLVVNPHHQFEIFSTHDHESPISRGCTPLLVLDLWEHAYYLKHQNKREEYVKGWWNIVDWTEVGARWEEIKATGSTSREWQIAS
jgi:superoxide dismutase, Fe-Mn family